MGGQSSSYYCDFPLHKWVVFLCEEYPMVYNPTLVLSWCLEPGRDGAFLQLAIP